MLQMAETSSKSIAQMKQENDLSQIENRTLSSGLARIWQVMSDCIDRRLERDGFVPGDLYVRRRAKGIYVSLIAELGRNLAPPHTINDWMSLYAMAVNEENAVGGQVVTAPRNVAAGVLPAVLRYYLDHVPCATKRKIEDFLSTAAAIGEL